MKILENIKLDQFTSFKIGGVARYFVELSSKEDLEKFLEWKQKVNLPIFVLGGGTNILADDFRGIILKPKFEHIERIEETKLVVGSGVLVSDLLNKVIEFSLKGLEWAGGLPGTVGGAIEGGVGCFGGEFKNLVFKVKTLNLENGNIENFKKEECMFEYRNSIFRKERKWLIIEATLEFVSYPFKDELKEIAQEKINYRKEKHPLEYPNAGSIFKNIPFEKAPKVVQNLALEKNKVKNDPFKLIPIGFLIAEAGLVGKRIGDAQVSQKHANFIVNLGKASFSDVYNLIEYIKKTIEDKFSISPELEIQIIKC